MKRTAITILFALAAMGCVPQSAIRPQYSVFIPNHPECRAVFPPADDIDPDHDPLRTADYEARRWVKDGRTLGFSRHEDSTVWGLRSCTNL